MAKRLGFEVLWMWLWLWLWTLSCASAEDCSTATSEFRLSSSLNETAHWLSDVAYKTQGTLEEHLKPLVTDVSKVHSTCGDSHTLVMKTTIESPPPSTFRVKECPLPPPCPLPGGFPCPPVPPCFAHRYPDVEGYEYVPLFRYYKLHQAGKTWLEAKQTCKDEGSNLAVINYKAEAERIQIIIGKKLPNSPVFLGYSYSADKGEFTTVHSESPSQAGYDKWSENEPAKGSGMCGAIRSSSALEAIDCSREEAFLCEI